MTSQGPDRLHGPPCCHGLPTNPQCDEYGDYSDSGSSAACSHYCCCFDPCKHYKRGEAGTGLGPCDDACCKFVPRAILARVTPTTPSAQCRDNIVVMEATFDDLETIYEGDVPGIGHVRFSVGTDAVSAEYKPCRWTLQIASQYIDDVYPITAGYPYQCGALPDIDPIEVSLDGDCEPCTATVTFELYEEFKIPFMPEAAAGDYDGYDDGLVSVPCGEYGQLLCRDLCVWRVDADEYDTGVENSGEPFVNAAAGFRTRFRADYTGIWTGGLRLDSSECGNETIEVVEVDGKCYLKLTDLSEAHGVFTGDLIELKASDFENALNVSALDAEGNYINIRCGTCWCWNYVCGKCRCICPEICLIGQDDGALVGPMKLSWSADNSGWGNDEYGETVTIHSADGALCDSTTSCYLTVAGFEDEEHRVPIPLRCGSAIAFEVSDTQEDGSGHVSQRWRSVWCSRGGSCDNGRCLGNCDTIPKVIYAEVVFNPDSPSADYPDILAPPCWEPFTVPMYLVGLPGDETTGPTVAWRGKAVFPCRDSSTPFHEEDFSVPQEIELELDCIGELRVRFPGTDNCEVNSTFVAQIPCSSCDDPLDVTVGDTSPPGTSSPTFYGMNCRCCGSPGGFYIHLTE